MSPAFELWRDPEAATHLLEEGCAQSLCLRQITMMKAGKPQNLEYLQKIGWDDGVEPTCEACADAFASIRAEIEFMEGYEGMLA